MNTIKQCYLFDEKGFFNGVSLAQADPEELKKSKTYNYILPPSATFAEPELSEDAFACWDGAKWSAVAKPKTAADCALLGAVSHTSHTAHDEELRQLFQKLTEGSEEYQIERGDDLSWKVVEKPQKSEAEKKAEAKQQRVAELKSKLAATDYCVIKIAEGEATTEQYAQVLEQRKAWREEINMLENS